MMIVTVMNLRIMMTTVVIKNENTLKNDDDGDYDGTVS